MDNSHQSSGQEKFDKLREEFPFLEYTGYEVSIDQAGLHVKYGFNLAGKYSFHPGFSIPRKRFLDKFPTMESIASPIFQNILFHIGLIELVSYWKAACPKEVIICDQNLSAQQVGWWKNVFYQGQIGRAHV